jgi:hypothetical protein
MAGCAGKGRRRGRLGAAMVIVGLAATLTSGTAGARTVIAGPGVRPAHAPWSVTAYRGAPARDLPALGRVAARTVNDALAGVSCTRLSRCWAVGYAGTSPSFGGTLAERWDRRSRRWVRVASPNAHGAEESNLDDVSCTSSSSCIAVGAKETAGLHVSTLAERWNGRTWSMLATPHLPGHPSSLFWGVSCTGATNCWGVGSFVTNRHEDDTADLIEQWNGATWSVVIAGTQFDSSALYHVSCASAASCMAVGTYTVDPFGYPYAEHWNGTVWSPVFSRHIVTSQSSQLGGVSCPTASRCVAVGNYALEDPTSTTQNLVDNWTAPATLVQTLPVNPSTTVDSQLIGDDCPRASACVAVGDEVFTARHVKTLAESWNGSTWSIVPTPDAYRSRNIELVDVSCARTSDCFAVGVDFGRHAQLTTLAERWDGHTWTVVTSQNP